MEREGSSDYHLDRTSVSTPLNRGDRLLRATVPRQRSMGGHHAERCRRADPQEHRGHARRDVDYERVGDTDIPVCRRGVGENHGATQFLSEAGGREL